MISRWQVKYQEAPDKDLSMSREFDISITICYVQTIIVAKEMMPIRVMGL